MSSPHLIEPIDGEEVLWRRLTDPAWIVTNPDGTKRISSAAFKDSTEDRIVSVHIASLTSLERVMATPPVCFGIAAILTRHPEQLGHVVRHTPTPEDFSHASIIPPAAYGSSRRKRDTKDMAGFATLVEGP